MTEIPTTDSDTEKSDDYQEKRAELIERTKERKQSLTEEQDAILDDIQQEHGGELIETACRITPNHTVDVSVDLNGEFIDRMGEIEDLNERIESGDTMASGTSEVMDKTSQLLADAVDDPEWTKDLFYQVYRENEPKALGELFGNIADAVKKERKRKAGAVDGFPNRSGD